MIQIEKSVTVPYTVEQMFALVSDVSRYAEFIPWCQRSFIEQQTANSMIATLCFARLGMQYCFTTRNQWQSQECIDLSLVKGPFKFLAGSWHFIEKTPEQTLVKLELRFQFLNKLISMAFGPLFNQITNTLVDAFSARAEQVYGKTKKIND